MAVMKREARAPEMTELPLAPAVISNKVPATGNSVHELGQGVDESITHSEAVKTTPRYRER